MQSLGVFTASICVDDFSKFKAVQRVKVKVLCILTVVAYDSPNTMPFQLQRSEGAAIDLGVMRISFDFSGFTYVIAFVFAVEFMFPSAYITR